ncbi:hypothetical protein RHGRI_031727 [Rhododendron griersonianum]|uniref:Annexin n=1 Tax=Rhododendron griersonianum TaxID=479676 RepID=A0AAV6I8W6_9ERIC|nr:hypothetical protein RHGRI_031727 [Rhododendron griersonianum]
MRESITAFSGVRNAHAKDSAKASIDTIQMAYPKAKLVLVVAMASDKDHSGFARELLSGANLTDRDLREVLKKYRKSCSIRPVESLTRPRKNRLSRGY